MNQRKSDIVTFKVDPQTRALLDTLPNRSAFIRQAVLQALDSMCPVCQGSGLLTPKQQEHWISFSQHHQLQKCRKCHEVHLTCEAETDACLSPE